MLDSCQDSWENSSKKRNKKSYYTENTDSDKEEQAFFTKDFKVSYKKMCQDDNSVEDVVLYTGENKTKINFLGSETLGSIILDCGCSQNVCGEYWLKSYVASLSEEDQKKIEEITDEKKTKFRFGRGETLSLIKKIKILAEIADKKVSLITHVVSSGIPLLWSQPSMTRAGVVLDLPSDRAKILGKMGGPQYH